MSWLYRGARRLAPLALALVAGACGHSHDHDEPEIEAMRLTIAGQAPITVNATGAQSGTLNLVAGTATAITVEFLDANGVAGLGEHAEDFQAQVLPGASSGITFTRTGPFAGTLTASLVGSGRQVALALLHVVENHEDFGPFNVNFTVTGAAVVARQ